jgi:hypothetical protein
MSCHILQLNISGWSFALYLYFVFVQTQLENPVSHRQVVGTDRQDIKERLLHDICQTTLHFYPEFDRDVTEKLQL